jgi:amino acid transporter
LPDMLTFVRINYVWTRPPKFFPYLYSVMFVVLSGSHANALVFGSSIIKANNPHGGPVDPRLEKVFAILLSGVVCFFQSFSRLNYIRFSDAFALYKVCFLTVLTILGFCALGGKRFSASNAPGPYGIENLRGPFDQMVATPYVIAIALLDIMRAYAGYENVNWVRTAPKPWIVSLNPLYRYSKK